jgi:cellulose synthase/poly-beta-1,6-N-acetylglucosamine synthase-like glycosyltransferase
VSVLAGALAGVNVAMLVYLIALNLAVSMLIAATCIANSLGRRRQTLIDYQTISGSELASPLSIIVPVGDRKGEIVASVRALLDAGYPTLEVVVVDDGTEKGTLDALRRAFSLVQVERVPRANLASRLVLGVYASPQDARLLVLEKEAGSRADAINAGLRFARYPLFCPVDAGVTIDCDALVRMARTFQTHPETIACGASMRIADGGSLLASVQRVGRLRALLLSRTGASRLGTPFLGCGPFGVFRRDMVVDAGGYAPDAVGEDLDLALRLHRHCRDRGLPYRLAFVAQPVGTTAAAHSLGKAFGQELRWQRGLVQALSRHRGMLFRRRYGAIGWVALPYLSLVAALGQLAAIAAYGAGIAGFALGAVDPALSVALVVLGVTSGLGVSLGALLLDERPRPPRFLAATIAEGVGYRQIVTLARACGSWAPRRTSPL